MHVYIGPESGNPVLRHCTVFDMSRDDAVDLNMNETPVFFYLPSNRTVDRVGSKTVTVRTKGNEKTHFTKIYC